MPSPRRAHRAAAGTLAIAVCLSAGAAALAGSASAAAGFSFSQRLGGADRFATAVQVSQKAFPDGSPAGAVVLVNANRTVDGLTAAYVAGLHDAPILFTAFDALTDPTAQELTRLGTREVYIVGGTGVVSADLQTSLERSGHHVVRYGGADRYETAALAADSGTTTPGRVYVASGERPADALVVSPVAYARHYPVLLTRRDDVPATTAAELARLGQSDRTVVGGPAVVAEPTKDALGAGLRLAGQDRQGTAVAVAEDSIANEGASSRSLGLVGGLDANTVDALAAASVAGRGGVPLLFVQGDSDGAATDAYLRRRAPQLTGTGYVFGGEAAVSPSAVAAANAAAGNADATAAAQATRPTLAVGPTGRAPLAAGQSRTYTVTGLDDAASYDLALFPADDVYFYPNGTITFRDIDGDNTADDLGATQAVVSVGQAVQAGAGHSALGVRPQGGTITFTTSSPAADRTNPVVWKDTTSDGQLDLVTPTTKNGFGKGSVEAFGVGGETDWS